MNTKRIAEALNTVSLAFAELAEAIAQPEPDLGAILPAATPARALASDVASARATGTVPASEPSPFEDEAVTWVPPDTLPTEPVGSLAQCPKHHSDYLPSQFKEGAFYCPKDSDDQAWRNSKGKCRITPVNAAEYLRIKAAA